MSGRRSSTWDGTPDGTAGIASSRIDFPRSTGPGLRPSRMDRAFSVCAICDSTPGIAAAAVSYWERACSTFIRETTPYWCCSSNSRHRLAVGRKRLLREQELFVQPPQLQVRAGDGGDEREDHAPLCILGAQEACLRRFGQPADAAPEIDLPARRAQDLVGRLRVGDGGRQGRCPVFGESLPLGQTAVVELREDGRSGLDEQAPRLLDLGSRDLDVLVVGQCLVDEGVQDRVLELSPPLCVGRVARILVFIPIRARDRRSGRL